MGYYEKLIEQKNEFMLIYGLLLRVRKGKKGGYFKSVKIEFCIGSSVFFFFMLIYFFDKDGWMFL